jgi:hypothetical protein
MNSATGSGKNTKMPPISSFFGRWLVKNPFFLFAGTLLFDEKIRESAEQPVFRTIWET